jgi:hypothetical protein
MVELFAGSSGMAIATQLTPPPGAYSVGADRGRCCRVLYNYTDRSKKKLIKKIIKFILVSINFKVQCPQSNGINPPARFTPVAPPHQ